MGGRSFAWLGLTVILGLFATGCQTQGDTVAAGGPILVAPDDTISVYQLAERLNLEARCTSRLSTILTDAANTVIVYSNPGGRVFVNGKQVGPSGGIACVDGILFLSSAFEAPIRGALRPAARRDKPPVDDVPPVPDKKKPPRPADAAKLVIDPGHGGKDPGAIGVGGVREKAINLSVAGELSRCLRSAGHNVAMTRDDDTFIELADRSDVANRKSTDLFVSIHADAASRASARGYTVYVARQASAASVRAAEAIERSLGSTGLPSLGVRRADYRVLVNTACPSVLVELGFVTNSADASALSSDAFQKRLAKAVADGVAKAVGGQ